MINYQKNISLPNVACTSGGVINENGWSTGSSGGASCISSSTSNTFGNWQQYTSGLLADSWLFGVAIMPTVYSSTNGVVQIGTGAAASETPIVQISFEWDELQPSQSKFQLQTYTLPVPRKIAAGTRVAMRFADTENSARYLYVYPHFYGGLE